MGPVGGDRGGGSDDAGGGDTPILDITISPPSPLSPLHPPDGAGCAQGHQGQGGLPRQAARSPPLIPPPSPPYTLQMELAVLKAIKGREDCLDRLRAPLP